MNKEKKGRFPNTIFYLDKVEFKVVLWRKLKERNSKLCYYVNTDDINKVLLVSFLCFNRRKESISDIWSDIWFLDYKEARAALLVFLYENKKVIENKIMKIENHIKKTDGVCL
ncbi:MAG: hypothetical protein WC516_06410 [Patescibacteria group bacterium]